MTKERFSRLLLATTALIMVHNFLAADETVYNEKEIPLAEMNKKVFGRILKKPYTEKYKKLKNTNRSDWFFIDIRKACNMGFEDDVTDNEKGGWTDSGKGYDLHPFGPGYGVVEFYGVPFNIIDPAQNNNKTMITMKSGWKTGKNFPEEVELPVNKKAAALYFFHASSWAGSTWGAGASRRYEVVYDDGTVLRVPIICAGGHENMGNWMWKPSGGAPLLDTSSAKPVPVKIGPKDIRYLFTLEWINPHPGRTIKKIRIVTKNDKKWFTIVTLAVTVLKPENK
jgi:beta-galactosidase